MAKLEESAHRLESDLDSRLVQMGSDIISGARTQLEKALDAVLKELGTRNSQELGKQRDDACEHLKSVQKGIESSISQLLKSEVTGSLLSFGQTMEELAQDFRGTVAAGTCQGFEFVCNHSWQATSAERRAEKPGDSICVR